MIVQLEIILSIFQTKSIGNTKEKILFKYVLIFDSYIDNKNIYLKYTN